MEIIIYLTDSGAGVIIYSSSLKLSIFPRHDRPSHLPGGHRFHGLRPADRSGRHADHLCGSLRLPFLWSLHQPRRRRSTLRWDALRNLQHGGYHTWHPLAICSCCYDERGDLHNQETNKETTL